MFLLLVFLFTLIIIVALIYNSFISKKNMAEKAFATIDVMLKKRFDLIPGLVETVKGYAKHERETLEKLIEIRATSTKNISNDEKIRLGIESAPLMTKLLALSENYPDLKANQNFLNLQKNLTEIEEQISAARRAYNAAVTDFNNSCEMFPGNLFAMLFGFNKKSLFSITEDEKINKHLNF